MTSKKIPFYCFFAGAIWICILFSLSIDDGGAMLPYKEYYEDPTIRSIYTICIITLFVFFAAIVLQMIIKPSLLKYFKLINFLFILVIFVLIILEHSLGFIIMSPNLSDKFNFFMLANSFGFWGLSFLTAFTITAYSESYRFINVIIWFGFSLIFFIILFDFILPQNWILS